MKTITAKTKICMVIGDPIAHSLSPQIHNAGYQALALEDQFVYVAAQVKVEHIEDFIKGIRAMNIRGVSCTMPHKLAVMKYLDILDETAKTIGAVNTIVNEKGVLTGYNTDWLGVVTPLETLTPLKNKEVAVLGAGGAARAIIYGLRKKEAKVTIFNRTQEKAEKLAEEFNTEIALLSNREKLQAADIIINATSVGMTPYEKESPIDTTTLQPKQIVLDAIYHPRETLLLQKAKSQGALPIPGIEMLLYQAIAQFELYTKHTAPEDAMRKVLYET
jgi:shikimate dehydrogenase